MNKRIAKDIEIAISALDAAAKAILLAANKLKSINDENAKPDLEVVKNGRPNDKP